MSDPKRALLPGVGRKPMKIPGSASDAGQPPDPNEAFILNRFAGKELLTVIEAVDCINYLSGAILADGRKRG